jgi:hypothetical protein
MAGFGNTVLLTGSVAAGQGGVATMCARLVRRGSPARPRRACGGSLAKPRPALGEAPSMRRAATEASRAVD